MQTANRKSGYTLIELLVGLTIIAIVFSIGFAGYRDFSRRQAVAGVTKSIQSDLRNAQQLALTGQKPTVDYLNNPVTCTRLSGYSFSRISAINYQIIANCVNAVNANHIVKNITLSSDLSLSAGSVKFKVLGQGTDLSAPVIFTVTHTAGTTGTITVGIGGDVK
jgi:prepilin-type N-terminal cleavage/methylation domain-containing protein